MKAKIILLVLAIAGVFLSSCVKDEIFQGPPVISEIQLNPQGPQEGQAVTVSAKVSDLNGVKAVALYYKVGEGSYTAVNMTAADKTWSGQIPGQAGNAMVAYYIQAENVIGKTALFPAGAPASTAAYTVGAPLILMNEIYSRGLSAETPDPDWIEIYNNSDVAADISGYKVYDNGGQSGAKPKLAVPAGTILGPRGFYLIPVDIGGESGFGISSGGEELWFENANGNLIDNVIVPAMNIGQSYGRNPDGSSNWQLLPALTPGAPNSDEPPPAINYIVLNEVYSMGTAGNEDWIEVYNTSATAIDLSGYTVYDSGGNSGSKPKKAFPSGTSIAGNGFVYIRSEGGGDPSDFGISSGGEKIWLAGPSGAAVDSIDVIVMATDQSYGRLPDGTGAWQLLARLTPGAANSNVPVPKNFIVLNEIYSRGTAGDEDWIEVYNTSNAPVDLSGYTVYDSGGNSGSKPKKTFPEGTSIPGNGFVFIRSEGGGDPSDFGISSGGEWIWLNNPAGEKVDSVLVVAMAEGQSFGRLPDGTGEWQLLARLTPGEANSNTAPSTIELLHYWHFNALPSGTLTDPIAADFTKTGLGAANISYPGTGAGYMDNVSPGSEINARMSEAAGLGLRPRNPANTRELLIVSPSNGFQNLVVTLDIMRSSNGAAQNEFYYSADSGATWTLAATYDVPLAWELRTIDLSEVSAVNNKQGLYFKIKFVGEGADGASGNNRYDNIAIEGVPIARR